MELDELKPTGYFSEFSWIDEEDEEEEAAVAMGEVDVFAPPLRDQIAAADKSAVPVMEQQGATPS